MGPSDLLSLIRVGPGAARLLAAIAKAVPAEEVAAVVGALMPGQADDILSLLKTAGAAPVDGAMKAILESPAAQRLYQAADAWKQSKAQEHASEPVSFFCRCPFCNRAFEEKLHPPK